MASLPESVAKAFAPLRDLSLSQRVAIGLGAALVAVSLVWMTQWAATPEMVPLLPNQDLKADELAGMRAALEAMNVRHKVAGSRILVPASENRSALLAQLGTSEKLPSDTSTGFAALVSEANPWISQEENNKRWTVGLQSELRKVLRQLAGVRDAHVFLNLNTQRRGFTRSEPAASASVTLFTRSGESVTRGLALAAARLVSGAVRGLPLRNVEVIDGSGAVALDWESEQPGGRSALDRQRREYEQQLAQTIRTQIAFDPHVRVSVRVEIDPTARESNATTPIEGVESRRSERRTEAVRGSRSGQPGIQPNVGQVAGAGALAETTTQSDQESEFQTGVEHRNERTDAGDIKEIYTAINLSHSALVGVFKRSAPDAGEPSKEDIETVFREQSERVTKQVLKLVKPQDPNQVAVEWYYDEIEPRAAEPAAASFGLELAQKYGPASALALLALLALGLMLRMGRGGDQTEAFGLEVGLPKEAIEAARRAEQDIDQIARARAAKPRGPGASSESAEAAPAAAGPGAPLPVGAADEALLEGREVDQGMAQVRQMIEQVAQLADGDTDAIAGLVEKWIERPR